MPTRTTSKTAVLIQRQEVLTKVTLALSEIEHLRGRSQPIIDMIAPLSNADAIYVYRADEDGFYRVATSWGEPNNLDCAKASIPIPIDSVVDTLTQRMSSKMSLSLKDMSNRGRCMFPVIEGYNVQSALVYPLTAGDDNMIYGILIFVSSQKKPWCVLCKEWLDSIAAMLTSAIRRTYANEMLSRELRFRDKIYPIIAHDLRSAVGGVKMMIQALNHQHMEPEDRKYLTDMLERGADEAFMLLDNLLKWSRSNIVRVEAVKESVDIHEMINGVLAIFRPIAAAKSITIEAEVAELLPPVMCDPEMVRTILRNLLSNAVKFSYPEGVIRIGCRFENGLLNIVVEDHGMGMTPEQVAKLNTEGEHFTTSGTAAEKGSGLGYILCRHFAHLHDGKINIESTPGEGSRFTLYLPM